MIERDEITDVGLGTWVLGEYMWSGETDPEDVIEESLQNGINLIDTAPVYGKGRSEERVGRALGRLDAREEVFLATKCGLEWEGDRVWRNSRPNRLRQEIRDSLERLDVDTIDLYQVHWPDEEVPFAETMELLEEFRDDGLIRYIGLSNFSVQQMQQARKGGTIDFLQPPYNLFERGIEENVLPFCRENNIDTLVYSSLCRGLLTGKYERPEDLQLEEGDIRLNDAKFTDRKAEFIDAVNNVKDYLADRGHREDLAPLMIRWTTEQPGVTCALVGARNREQARSNATALDVSLDEEELQEIRAIVDRTIQEPVGPEFMAPPHSDPAT